jgi:PAS domain S-box-containing protein
VLASAGVGAIDGNVDLGRLGPLPPVGRDSVGRYVPGRGLAALADGPPPAPAPPGVGFVPMLRTVDAGGRPLVILGLVNPDAIANHQQQILDDAHSAAWLADYGGRVVAATATAPVAPGGLVNELPAFESMLPRVEHGNYIGRGLRPGEQIVAFRASRTRPLVVMVESPLDTALAGWHALAYGLLAVGAAATLVIAAMTVVAARSLRTRELAQAVVAQREHELSVIVKSVQELIFRTDAAGRLTFVNARWQAATGQPAERLLGRRFGEIVEPVTQADAAALFAGGAGGTRRAQLQFEGGAGRRFDVAVTPLLEGGAIAGFAGSAVDVTTREAAQARLRSELAFSALLVDTMPMPLSLLDREGRYVTVNRAWEDLTGRHRDVVIGTLARSYLPPEEAAVHDGHDRQLVAEGGQVRYEIGFTHQDGSRRQLAVVKARPSAPRARHATPPRRPRARSRSSSPTSATNCARRCSRSSASPSSAWRAAASTRSWRRCSATSTPRASACWRSSTTCSTCPRSRARSAPSTSSAPTCAR